MHGATFLQDLAVVMIIAGLVTVVFHRFKQPVVLGYILAGVIIGPHTPPFSLIIDPDTIKTLSGLGVVFLMFSLGLDFSLRRLKKVGATAFIATPLEVLLMAWVGYEAGRLFGWKNMDCVFLGAMLSISSTTIIVKALAELGRNKESFAELIYGILIVEDILAIVMMALLPSIAMTGNLVAGEVVSTFARLGIFLVVSLVLGLLLVPRLIGYLARFKSNEMLLVAVLGLCFGVSLLAAKLQYSVALGAFIIGAVIAESKEIARIERLTEPIRDMFGAVFFVSIGLLIDPALLVHYWAPILALSVAVVAGKVMACTFGAYVAGNDTRNSLRVGLGLAQIGEFSFIIASMGLTLNATSDFLYPIAVAVSAITTLTTPLLIKRADGLVNWFDRTAPREWVNYLAIYTRWVGLWRNTRHESMASRLIRRWTMLMALNLAIVSGIFIAAAFLGQRSPSWLPRWVGGESGYKAALWFCAVLASLPLLIANYKKMQALGMLVGEMISKRLVHEPRAAGIQAIVSNTVPIGGVVGMALLLLVLSSAVLPSGNVLFALLLIVAGVTFLLWQTFIRVYSKAQFALEDTFANPPPARQKEISAPLAGLLKEAEIEEVTLPAGSPLVGVMIKQTALRTQTGASIVAIERAGVMNVNPDPEELLRAGDQLLLLGSQKQLDEARRILIGNA